jgi:type 1 glutamine amidotransferase
MSAATPLKVLIVDGQNNHAWQETTPYLRSILEETGLFTVEVATTPPAKSDMSSFNPDFTKYDVVVSNYNGDSWPAGTQAAFEKYMREGGGFVAYHAANNAFPEWKEFNLMTALGGWGGRTEQSGPYARFRDGKLITEAKPGRSGSHGARLPFLITMRDMEHPISQGLPEKWMHAADELYDSLRGPAQNMTLLATAFSEPANRGTAEHEPMLFTVRYDKGRIFHTTLGHDVPAMKCTGFIATFQRGTEWAASGKVTQKVPDSFPTSKEVKTR